MDTYWCANGNFSPYA